ncbi:hypothetical protein [Constantimarinum furrinae]|nr:hypothetical protein [Constantimarinum furrinae]
MRKFKQYEIVLMVAAAAITIFGLITGKFLFVFVWLPLGFLFGKKRKE